jgi:UDP-N-acetylmuramoylalanine--D-glutamate ligase
LTLDELCRSKVALWGIGAEGLALLGLLADRGVEPLLIDDLPDEAAVHLEPVTGPGRRVLDPGAVAWGSLDVVVRAPGVSRYRPELAEAAAHGVQVTTAMAVWLEDFADARVVAVTGTKGKSTTAALCAAILRQAGLDVSLIGNIGVPVTEAYRRPLADAYVVEVSSYQASEVTVTPGVCLLTSLAPDHLDWHRGEERYYRDKLRLIDAGPPGALGVNAGSDEAVKRTAGHTGRILFGPRGRIRVDGTGSVVVDDEPLGPLPLLDVPGRHNLWNLCGAITGALLLDGHPPSLDAVAGAVAGFEGLPSRCRTVGERGGLTFVDDALASNPYATVASLGAFPDRELTVIVGGADRGVDPSGLVRALAGRRPIPRVIVLAPDPHRLADLVTSASGPGPAGPGGLRPAVEVAVDLEDAVQRAVTATPAGGVVLFSPAAPTPEGQGGYGERSRRFVDAAGLSARGLTDAGPGDNG